MKLFGVPLRRPGAASLAFSLALGVPLFLLAAAGLSELGIPRSAALAIASGILGGSISCACGADRKIHGNRASAASAAFGRGVRLFLNSAPPMLSPLPLRAP